MYYLLILFLARLCFVLFACDFIEFLCYDKCNSFDFDAAVIMLLVLMYLCFFPFVCFRRFFVAIFVEHRVEWKGFLVFMSFLESRPFLGDKNRRECLKKTDRNACFYLVLTKHKQTKNKFYLFEYHAIIVCLS